MGERHRIETSLNQEEKLAVKRYCRKHRISEYALIKQAVFEKIRGPENRSLKEFGGADKNEKKKRFSRKKRS